MKAVGIEEIAVDVVVVPARDINGFDQLLQNQLEERDWSGAWGSVEVVAAPSEWQARYVAVVGLGESNETQEAEALRRGLGRVLSMAKQQVWRSVAVEIQKDGVSVLARAAVEAVGLHSYAFLAYKKQAAEKHAKRALRELQLLVSKDDVDNVSAVVADCERVLAGVQVTRDLINQPASHMSPALLVEQAEQIASSSDQLKVTVWDREKAEKHKFTGFLAVARGSLEEPYVIHLQYTPQKKASKSIVLVGKGVTFDSGGLSLKPAQFMENMKIDMGGAATVLGVFAALAKMDVPVEVHGVIAACENMPSGNAYRPGDILTAKNGKTIEVLNTDAEGRITLADALTYAQELKPDAIVDLATLTGACLVALGDTYAGLFSNNKELAEQLQAAAEQEGEGLAELPMPIEYKQTVESKVADVRNVSTMERMGGAITAAWFLREFVEEDVPWAHIDLAGPVFSERPLIPYLEYGATGYGVRTLITWLRSLG